MLDLSFNTQTIGSSKDPIYRTSYDDDDDDDFIGMAANRLD